MLKLKIIGFFAILSLLISYYSFGQIIEIKTTKVEVEEVQQEEIQSSISNYGETDQQTEKQKNSLISSPISAQKKSDPHKTTSKPALVSIFQEIISYWFAAPLEYKN